MNLSLISYLFNRSESFTWILIYLDVCVELIEAWSFLNFFFFNVFWIFCYFWINFSSYSIFLILELNLWRLRFILFDKNSRSNISNLFFSHLVLRILRGVNIKRLQSFVLDHILEEVVTVSMFLEQLHQIELLLKLCSSFPDEACLFAIGLASFIIEK